jgi:hypothetical protein
MIGERKIYPFVFDKKERKAWGLVQAFLLNDQVTKKRATTSP